MNQIVECIPNFSEGRRPDVVEDLVKTINSVRGAVVLDREMDANHNRSVLTFVGEPKAVLEAVFRAVRRAAELIDLNQHEGEHPRLGATDVVPFVPIKNVTMNECVDLAKLAGRRIAEELKIPVYLYENAATRPDRQNLANIRKGEFEGLRDDIASNPGRMPDFGEPMIHPTAGATVIGARSPLIAYNVNLGTADLEIAQKIAKAVRHMNGGLRYVKALGFELKDRGIVQVSMNLVNYEGTPVYRAFEMVKREAQRYGVPVAGSEIVGLIPQAALDACSDFFLQIERFDRGQILENRLQLALSALAEREAPAGEKLSESIGHFHELVGSVAPTPGGGSVAAHSALMACSLGQMVCRLTLGKKKFADVHEQIKKILVELQARAEDMSAAIDEDAESYDRVTAAFRLPKETDAERLARENAIQEALKGAAAVPLRTAEKTEEVMELLDELSEIGNPTAISDTATGTQMALAGLRGACYNVEINLRSITDPEFVKEYREKVAELRHKGWELSKEIENRFSGEN